ncbi:MAG: type II toxin-antitoxin system Phd/YefM family antitoxin [Candidatus Krumholzibacteriia bacterium]
MAKIPRIIPVTELCQDAAAVLKRLRSGKQPLIITQRGRATAVIIGIEAYERSEHERELLRLLARGERDIAGGKGHSLGSVMVDADTL